MTIADKVMLIALGVMVLGGAVFTAGFWIKVTRYEHHYLSTKDLQPWRPMTPEEAARNHIPLNQYNAR